MTAPAVAVVGGGRVGLTLARALALAGSSVVVLSRTVRTLPPPLHTTSMDWATGLRDASIVLLAVPDDQIGGVAERLLATSAIAAGHTVLHISGRLDRTALAALDPTGAALGSLHPLQTYRNENGGGVFDDVPAILEGDARAVRTARTLAGALQMQPILEIPAAGKAEYHAAAVFASNYLVVLAALAERLGREAGLEANWQLFLPLMRRTLEHLTDHDPAASLTGPIRRGDVGTVRAHLAALNEPIRSLYAGMGREALQLAKAELPTAIVAELERLLET